MEMTAMGSLQLEIRDNEILREICEEVMAEGEAKGEAKGEARGELLGMVNLLRGLLHAKFGSIPKWAEKRLVKASKSEIEHWSKEMFNAQRLEDVIAQRQASSHPTPTGVVEDSYEPPGGSGRPGAKNSSSGYSSKKTSKRTTTRRSAPGYH